MQLDVIENELQREYAPLATIKSNMDIEFTFNGANDLYLDLNNLRLHVLAKIIKSDETKIDPTQRLHSTWLHSMFREIGLELNGRNVGDTSSSTRISHT